MEISAFVAARDNPFYCGVRCVVLIDDYHTSEVQSTCAP
jgi:hypothetical protein